MGKSWGEEQREAGMKSESGAKRIPSRVEEGGAGRSGLKGTREAGLTRGSI